MNVAQVVRDQRQELEEGLRGKKLIRREAEGFFKDALKSKLVKVVTGVRRCGKSVFSHSLLASENFAYATFDDDRLSGSDANDVLSALYEVYGKGFRHVFLDEVQNLEGWELFVNRIHRTGFNVIVTGSNSRLLSRELATALTGRHMRIELFPFSFREFLSARKFGEDVRTTRGESLLKRELQAYIDSGSFPDVVVEKEDPRIFLRELYRNIIERDVVGRHRMAYGKTFREIALSLLSNPGRGVSFNKLKNQFGLGSEHTVKNYASYLEEAYLIFLLNRFSHKPVEVEKSDKKVYAIDPGMINAVSSRSTPDFGHLFENSVALELLRRKSCDPGLELYYWKSPLHEEVDFVLKKGLRVNQLIQVTYDTSEPDTKERETRSLLKAARELACRNLLVVNRDFEGEEKTRQRGVTYAIKYVPLCKWLLEEPRP